MLDEESNDLKILEMNTIAAAGGCISDWVKLLQEYVIKEYEQDHIDPSKIAKE